MKIPVTENKVRRVKMNGMFVKFGRFSLTAQYVLLTTAMLIILLISFTITDSIVQNIIEKKAEDSASKILLQVEDKILTFYSDIDAISAALLYSPTIQKLISNDDSLERILMDKDIDAVFSNTVMLNEDIKGIQIYNNKGDKVAGIGEDASVTFFKRKISNTEYSGLLKVNRPLSESRYSITIPIFKLDNNVLYDNIGTCVFVMDTRNFADILDNSLIVENAKLLLLDQMGNIITSEGVIANRTPDLKEMEKSNNYIIQKMNLSRTSWSLISIIPKHDLFQDMNILKRLNLVAYIIMLGLMSLFLLIFFIRILKPVRELIVFMKAYPKKSGVKRFDVGDNSEIGVLALHLNKMLDDIELLSSEVQQTQKKMYEIELARKQMEVASYRNQINPHFLYNTLECIRAIALYRNADEIAEITASLSNMFRYAVKGNDFVTVADEVSHVQEYAKIIEFRFNGRIRIELEVQEDILAERMIKMLLQPIVENAVFHGLERKLGKGKVAIRILKLDENKMQALITDNGFGMEEAKLQEVRTLLRESGIQTHSEQDKSESIGIQNIYRRLKLFYEDNGNMAIESSMNEGTTVIMTFPILKKKANRGLRQNV
jgi:two-component system sensor histidine kinase YesM